MRLDPLRWSILLPDLVFETFRWKEGWRDPFRIWRRVWWCGGLIEGSKVRRLDVVLYIVKHLDNCT